MVDKFWTTYIKPKGKNNLIFMPSKTPIILNEKRAREKFNEIREEYRGIKATIDETKRSFDALKQIGSAQSLKLMHIKRDGTPEKDKRIETGYLIAIYAKTEITAMKISKLYFALSKNRYADPTERESAQILAEDYRNCALNYNKEQFRISRRN